MIPVGIITTVYAARFPRCNASLQSFTSCRVDIRKNSYANVVLSGGPSSVVLASTCRRSWLLWHHVPETKRCPISVSGVLVSTGTRYTSMISPSFSFSIQMILAGYVLRSLVVHCLARLSVNTLSQRAVAIDGRHKVLDDGCGPELIAVEVIFSRFYAYIVLSGGTITFSGIGKFMTTVLTTLAPSTTQFMVMLHNLPCLPPVFVVLEKKYDGSSPTICTGMLLYPAFVFPLCCMEDFQSL